MSASERVRSLLLRSVHGLRIDGLGPTIRRARTHLFGEQRSYVFVRHPNPPSVPVEFPVETNGIAVRQMTERDRADARIRRYEPRDIQGPCEAMLATRGSQIVGAAWYTDAVTAEQPWYQAVEPHLIPPARFAANIFVVPGDQAAAWALAKSATDRLATMGVRTIVGLVGTQNTRSVLMSRLLGAKMVARVCVSYWFGRRTTTIEPVSTDNDAGITAHAKS